MQPPPPPPLPYPLCALRRLTRSPSAFHKRHCHAMPQAGAQITHSQDGMIPRMIPTMPRPGMRRRYIVPRGMTTTPPSTRTSRTQAALRFPDADETPKDSSCTSSHTPLGIETSTYTTSSTLSTVIGRSSMGCARRSFVTSMSTVSFT
jgi:hypothetical protein